MMGTPSPRPRPRLLRVGDGGALVELANLADVVALNRALGNSRPRGVTDVIPAARTLLIRFEPESVSWQDISDWLLQERSGAHSPPAPSQTVLVPVRYDGEDLAEVGRLCGLTTAEVVALHTAADYTVAFCGFAPGFAYLSGTPAALRVSRRVVPRTRVPAGAVALADTFSGIYPRESPGGWQLIGRTHMKTFDLDADPPALLTPGTPVRFVEVNE